jgi:3-oxoacyl-[acyl-carrier protein] reductase
MARKPLRSRRMRRSAGAVHQVAEQYRGIDILVHNAGIPGFAPLPKSDSADYRRQFAVNVDGVFAGTRAAADHIRDGGRGRIRP